MFFLTQMKKISTLFFKYIQKSSPAVAACVGNLIHLPMSHELCTASMCSKAKPKREELVVESLRRRSLCGLSERLPSHLGPS